MVENGSSFDSNDPENGEQGSSRKLDPSATLNTGGDPGSTNDLPTSDDSSLHRTPEHISPDDDRTVISNRPPDGKETFAAASSPIEMGRTLRGQTLGYFHLEEFVGGGGMGAVFRARDSMLDRIVAVKVLARSQSTDEETRRRFQNEAQSAARLDHENIARVFYVGEDDGWHFIVFEFIEGVNIRDLVVEKGPLPLDEAVSYTLQVSEALSHAQQRDVVHRDIKPSNVLITPRGQVKLVDMGLARFHTLEASEGDLTASGVTLGTFDYISPEQARDPRVADVRSDIYSLGCTFFFMLTGRPPFPEGTVLQKLLSHTSDAPPDLRQFRPDIPDEVSTVLNKMLAKKPERRHQEPSQLSGDLVLLMNRLGLTANLDSERVFRSRSETAWSRLEQYFPWAIPLAVLFIVVALMDHMLPARDPVYPQPPARSAIAVSTDNEGDNGTTASTLR